MRRAGSLALTISLLLLCACGSGGSKREWKNWQESLREAESVSFTAELEADMGENVFRCTMEVSRRDGETTMTLTEPEIAAGITARIRDGETMLSYDGLELCVGTLPGGKRTPVESVPLLLDTLLSGYVTGWQKEKTEDGTAARLELYVDEESSALLWLREEDGTPLRMDLLRGGRSAVRCRITDFTRE